MGALFVGLCYQIDADNGGVYAVGSALQYPRLGISVQDFFGYLSNLDKLVN